MQAVKILLLFLMIGTVKIDAKPLIFSSAQDILNQFQLDSSYSWAVNGGLFKEIDDMNALPAGQYQILIKDVQGKVVVYDVNIQGQNVQPFKDNVLMIDTVGPDIDLTWLNAFEKGEKKIVGPKSKMIWRAVDEYSKHVSVFINNQPAISGQEVEFSENSSHVTVKAVDYFGNEKTIQKQLIADFQGPQLNWRLLSPAIKHNEKWLAGSNALVKIDAIDDVGVEHIMLNADKVDQNSAEMMASNNSVLIAVDKLGNRRKDAIVWAIDDEKPQVSVKIDGQTLDSKRHKYIVDTNQDILLTVEDNTSLKYAKYFSVNKQWEPLPKNFTFHKRGRNSIKVIAEDQFGNILKTKLKFRAKNNGKK